MANSLGQSQNAIFLSDLRELEKEEECEGKPSFCLLDRMLSSQVGHWNQQLFW